MRKKPAFAVLFCIALLFVLLVGCSPAAYTEETVDDAVKVGDFTLSVIKHTELDKEPIYYAILTEYAGTAESLTLPATCTTSKLPDVTVPVTATGNRLFYRKDTLKSVVVPEGYTKIGAFSFSYMAELAEVSLPSSITVIEEYAFESSTKLTTCSLAAAVPPEIQIGAFTYLSEEKSTKNEYIPLPGLTILVNNPDAYKAATGWAQYAAQISALQV